MKKVLISLLIILFILCGGAGAYYLYARAEFDKPNYASVPKDVFEIGSTKLLPERYEWNTHVKDFYFLEQFEYKSFNGNFENTYDIDVFEDTNFYVSFPAGYENSLSLFYEDETLIYSGKAEEFDFAELSENGTYTAQVVSEKRQAEHESYGKLYYTAKFQLDIPPPPAPESYTEISATEVRQGGVFSLRLMYLPAGQQPEIKTELGEPLFTPFSDGVEYADEVMCWQVLVPVSNLSKTGDYALEVTVDGEEIYSNIINVQKFDFVFQDLQIDTSSTQVSEASSSKAYAEFNEKIGPLRLTAHPEKLWEGVFDWPVHGRITTEFGTQRITNGVQSTLRSHYGMDIAAPVGTEPADYVGTEIIAPNNGLVVLAEYLLNTGWTIAIEHGGGLKTYYYHMTEIFVSEGDMLQKGDPIGTVGSTGYSNGPHLHYEMRIGYAAIDPTLFFDESTQIYWD